MKSIITKLNQKAQKAKDSGNNFAYNAYLDAIEAFITSKRDSELKDSFGNPIYEDDLIIFRKDDELFTRRAVYRDGSFHAENKDNSDYLAGMLAHYKTEVGR